MTRQLMYRGRKIEVMRETTVAADGRTLVRDVIVHPGAVAILPLLDAGRLCLIRNHRPAVAATLLEIPAGTLEPGEPPEHAAVRELTEETGYHAARWRRLTEFYPSPGLLSERTTLFVAEELTPGPMQPEGDEELEPVVVGLEEALGWVRDGTIRDAKTIIALLWWERLTREAASG